MPLAGELFPEDTIEFRIMPSRFEQAGVSTNNFFPAETGNTAEGIVYPEDDGVGIGDDGTFGHSGESGFIFPLGFFLAYQFCSTALGKELENGDACQSEYPDAQVPVLDGFPGRFLGGTVGVEIDGDGCSTAKPADRDKGVPVAFQTFFFHAHGDHDPHQAVPPFVGHGFHDHIGTAFIQGIKGFFFPVIRGIFNIAQLFGGEAFLDAEFLAAGFLNGQDEVNGGDFDEFVLCAITLGYGDPQFFFEGIEGGNVFFPDKDSVHIGGPFADGHILFQIGNGVNFGEGYCGPIHLFTLGEQRGEYQHGPDGDSQVENPAGGPGSQGFMGCIHSMNRVPCKQEGEERVRLTWYEPRADFESSAGLSGLPVSRSEALWWGQMP